MLSLIPFQSSVPFIRFWFAAFLGGGVELEQSPQMGKAFLVIASLVTYQFEFSDQKECFTRLQMAASRLNITVHMKVKIAIQTILYLNPSNVLAKSFSTSRLRVFSKIGFI